MTSITRFLKALITILLLCPAFLSFGDDSTNGGTNDNIPDYNIQARKNDIALGLKFENNFTSFPDDLRFGVNVNTPFFFNGHAALRFEYDSCLIRGNLMINSNGNEVWYSYQAMKAGVVYTTGYVLETIRPYFENGIQLVWPNTNFYNSEAMLWGPYGIIGCDFTFSPKDLWGWYVEAGVLALIQSPRASIYVKAPLFSNGIILAGGIRFYF